MPSRLAPRSQPQHAPLCLRLDSLSAPGRVETRFGTLEFDLTNGPMVIEQPPLGLGTIDDMWFNWAIDVGFPGPERGHLPGGYGTGIATALEGSVRLAGNPPVPETRFVGGSGTSFNTIPPSDIVVLRDDQRQRAGGAGGQLRSGTRRAACRHRLRQGQAIRAGRADAEDPHRRRRRWQCHRAGAELALQPRP